MECGYGGHAHLDRKGRLHHFPLSTVLGWTHAGALPFSHRPESRALDWAHTVPTTHIHSGLHPRMASPAPDPDP